MSDYPKIVMYTTGWCPYSSYTKSFFDRYNIPYDLIDIEQDEDAAYQVEQWNEGNRTVPTLVIDGKVYTNPGVIELRKMLGLL
jgi:mycoredoxin